MRYVEQSTLQRARDGDEVAFRDLTEPYRRELLVHCYRILGSLTDAEDVLQETLLAAWRGLAGFQQRASVRSWLYRIATNRCLNAIRDAGRRVPTETALPFPLPEPTRRDQVGWLQPLPDSLLAGVPDTAPGPEARYQTTEAVELAFVTALQRMPPRQAATLLLRDVLGFTADETAGVLGTSATAVKGTLQRARAALDQRRDPNHRATNHRGTDHQPHRSAVAEDRELGRRFAAAFTAADVEGVVALLTDDAWLSMPPTPHEYQGHDAIRAFLTAAFGHLGDRRMHLIATRANNQPAFGGYLAGLDRPVGLFVLTTAGDRIRAVTRFRLGVRYARFGLPDRLPAPA
jgi:RNA polymerase sigma-70 factor (TIGR02960 family)